MTRELNSTVMRKRLLDRSDRPISLIGTREQVDVFHRVGIPSHEDEGWMEALPNRRKQAGENVPLRMNRRVSNMIDLAR